jgi:NADH-quinone oxidoreductase subunit K
VKGPDVTWYLALAAILFTTGTLGVLVRRNPLIILLSVEIMLNGANLALIAFARHYGQEDGQIFALAVMAVAASEVVVGLGLIVALGRRHLELDVDKLRTLRG